MRAESTVFALAALPTLLRLDATHRRAEICFAREGLLRERHHVNGEVQDSVMPGLLSRDWLVAT